MKLSSLLLFLILAAAMASASEPLRELHLQKFEVHTPPLHFAAPGGTQKSLSDYKGKFVILHLWASWCGPCRVEMPALLRFAEKAKDPRVAVLLISVDKPEKADEVKKIFADLKIAQEPYMTASDDDTKRYFAWGVPMTYVFDPDGHLMARGMGALSWDAVPITALKNLIDSEVRKEK